LKEPEALVSRYQVEPGKEGLWAAASRRTGWLRLFIQKMASKEAQKLHLCHIKLFVKLYLPPVFQPPRNKFQRLKAKVS
jgi:hypothetical protein